MSVRKFVATVYVPTIGSATGTGLRVLENDFGEFVATGANQGGGAVYLAIELPDIVMQNTVVFVQAPTVTGSGVFDQMFSVKKGTSDGTIYLYPTKINTTTGVAESAETANMAAPIDIMIVEYSDAIYSKTISVS